MDDAQDMLSSLHGGSVGADYLNLVRDGRMIYSSCFSTCSTGFSHGVALTVTVDDIPDEPQKLVFHLLLQVEVISTPQELPLSHKTFCHLVKDRLLTLAVKAAVGITAGHTMKSNNTLCHCRCHKTVTVEDVVLPHDGNL